MLPNAATDRHVIAPINTAQKNMKTSQRCVKCISLRGQIIGFEFANGAGTRPSISA